MSIRLKLFALISSVIITFLLTAAILLAIQIPINNIKREELKVASLEQSLKDLQRILGEFILSPIQGHTREWKDANEQLALNYNNLETLDKIPSLSKEIQTGLTSAQNAYALIDQRSRDLGTSVEQVLESGGNIFPKSMAYSLYMVLSQVSVFSQGDKKSEFSRLLSRTQVLIRKLNLVNEAVDVAVKALQSQHKLINEEIEIMERRANLAGLILIIIGSLLSVFISALIAKHLVKNMRSLGNSVNTIAGGDFTSNIMIKAGGEFADLAKDMNNLQDQLRRSLHKIQNVSQRTEELRSSLITQVEETSGAVVEISANTQSIDKEMNHLAQEMDHTKSATQVIQYRIDDLTGHIMNQMAMVEESSAAIHQMTTSVKSVSDKTAANRVTVEDLVATSQEGGQKLQDTIASIGEMGSYITDVQKMVSLINNIAAQTNLLAMNAAIEAAHAGESGRGFSVVADEIRKLAEAASQNSKEISSSLKGISHAIDTANSSSEITKEAFSRIDSQINSVSRSFHNIDRNLSEISSGSTEISSALKELNNLSVTVESGAKEIRDSSLLVNQTVEKTVNVSRFVTGAVSEISLGMKEISDSVQIINQNSLAIGDVSEELKQEVRIFRTE